MARITIKYKFEYKGKTYESSGVYVGDADSADDELFDFGFEINAIFDALKIDSTKEFPQQIFDDFWGKKFVFDYCEIEWDKGERPPMFRRAGCYLRGELIIFWPQMRDKNNK